MKAFTSAALCAGAQASCAQADNAAFRPVPRRELLRALRKARTRLGLSTGDVLVLDALLSFLPCKDPRTRAEIPVAPEMMLIVYASNASICNRANGMDDRVLRRHITRLCERGFLGRKDSATGKRFPLKSGGRVYAAYGINLEPLMLAAVNIIEMADTVTAEFEEARSLKAEALTIRAGILRHIEQFETETIAFIERAKTILRRASLKLEGIREILNALRKVQARIPCPSELSCEPQPVQDSEERSAKSVTGVALTPIAQAAELQQMDGLATSTETGSSDLIETNHYRATGEESAGNGRSVRQVDSPKIDTNYISPNENAAPHSTWDHHRNITELFPEAPRTISEVRGIIYLLGKYLALNRRTLADAINSMGWLRCLKALDYLIANATRIKKPNGYFTRIVQDFQRKWPNASIST